MHMWRENVRTFPAGEYANRVNWPTGNSEWPVHNFPGNNILTFMWRIGDHEQARTVKDHFAPILHLVAFHDWRNWGRLTTDRNAKWNRKFPEFTNFQKKGQPREVDRFFFRNEFPETFCFIRFWTGISGNIVWSNGTRAHRDSKTLGFR